MMSSNQQGKKKRARESSSITSKYIPIKNVLELENKKEESVIVPEITDKSVKSYLKTLKPTYQSNKESVMVQIILCDSEADYFESDADRLEQLKEEFSVLDVSISAKHPDSIDRFMSITGERESIARFAVFITFIINSKFNTIPIKRYVYTLRSTNYHLRLYSTTQSNMKEEAHKHSTTRRLTGSFQELFSDIMKWSTNVSSNVPTSKVYGFHDSNLHAKDLSERSETNHKPLTYIYSK
ncbi:hypothetical protein DFJ63DRAFT_258604 [Scheffersomyces coipomensis]|uniref:uncharacterized protein n=1 Tax=Scheffersomyces coipomensis TaxID=1788519 RepID=UPI00315C7778